MTLGLLSVILVAIFLGSVAQRIAGVGFALLLSPILVMLLGAHTGIMMINICSVVSCGLIVPRVWADINWNMFWWLTIPATLGTIGGSFIAVNVPSAPLVVTVGAVVIFALVLSVMLHRASVTVSGNPPKALAGLGSGLTNSLAGVGGPTVSAYAVLARWPQREFAGTLQPYFFVICLITVGVRTWLNPSHLPQLDWWMWAALGVMIVVGIFTGEKLLRHIQDDHARVAVIIMAFVGAVAALIKGLLDLNG
ncbi:TSUP family transporter [Crystallibacter degradans]|uniref:TSUP family transporter n=1 Tax=Crystallibacter degradans TaxID=2726743 RepID=UPI001472E9B2|nr:sulfite exporter TauE/SafE family protein [Arthrobacter sp. SF27]